MTSASITQVSATGCGQCRNGKQPGFAFSMAFQPIVDIHSGEIFAQEALARGPEGEPAGQVLQQVHNDNLYQFDQACRVKAIELAARLNLPPPTYLSINFMPRAVYEPERCIATTLKAAAANGFPTDRIIFEVTEQEKLDDQNHLKRILQYYRRQGFLTAIDDFGAGHSGLNLLCDFQPDIVKLDMAMLRGIHQDPVRQAVVRGVLRICEDLSIRAVAEGVESADEMHTLRDLGAELFQGYHFARPAFEALPEVPAERLR